MNTRYAISVTNSHCRPSAQRAAGEPTARRHNRQHGVAAGRAVVSDATAPPSRRPGAADAPERRNQQRRRAAQHCGEASTPTALARPTVRPTGSKNRNEFERAALCAAAPPLTRATAAARAARRTSTANSTPYGTARRPAARVRRRRRRDSRRARPTSEQRVEKTEADRRHQTELHSDRR